MSTSTPRQPAGSATPGKPHDAASALGTCKYCIFLTPDQTVWCLEDPRGGVTCLLPAAGATPEEHLALPGLVRIGLCGERTDPPLPGARAVGLRALFDAAPAEQYAAAARAVPLAEWRRSARFCGRCGTALARDAVETAMVCPSCAHRVYPRINPVVIVRVTRGAEVLLARRAGSPPGGFFSVIAGFVEAGETLEEAAHREVLEETGVAIRGLRYFDSQPWSFPNNLMIAFTAEHAGGEVRPDGVEMAEAGWYRRDALPPLPGPVSIARKLLDAWRSERRPRPRE